MEGQARRIARRFALLAAVLEYAAPITGMRQGAGEAGVKQCFNEWLEENGTGNREDRRIIEQVIAFMDVNALSMRFQTGAPKPQTKITQVIGNKRGA